MRPERILIFCIFTALWSASWAQEVELITGNLVLDTSGSTTPANAHTIQLQRGQAFSVDLTSDDFDAVLSMISPSGLVQFDNDDYIDTNSRVEGVATESGVWALSPRSYGGEVGEFQLRMERGLVSSESGSVAGTLNQDSVKYGRYGVYDFQIERGKSIYMNVESSLAQGAITPSLTAYLHDPTGEIFEFDGYSPNLNILKRIERGGSWQLYLVNDNSTMDAVPYTLDYFIYESALNVPDYQEDGGRLGDDSEQLPSGEYFNTHQLTIPEFEGTFVVELVSEDFDTYMVLLTPGNKRFQNDDSDDPILSAFPISRDSDSKLEVSSSELDDSDFGVWSINVTSYSPKATGGYAIRHYIE